MRPAQPDYPTADPQPSGSTDTSWSALNPEYPTNPQVSGAPDSGEAGIPGYPTNPQVSGAPDSGEAGVPGYPTARPQPSGSQYSSAPVEDQQPAYPVGAQQPSQPPASLGASG
ncbi:hypothetical protein [Streptomyces sp. B3I7]|uniref:hypothetical protein n=1 Tax=Streptomyces sp. B3I7 TaxID=3042269 RepID=UPI0027D778D1|nr:hypothetical protein [Streptomyces sp. B3I7]